MRRADIKGVPLPDLKYFALIHGRHARKDRMLKVRSKCLQEVMVTFYNNLAGTDSFSAFPAVIAFEAVRDQFWRDCAVFKITGKLSIHERKFDDETERAISAEFLKLHEAERLRGFAGKSDIPANIRQGASRIEHMAAHELGSHDSIQNLLRAVVVQSWTAFETLAADLWFTALDYGLPEWRKRASIKYDNPAADTEEPPLTEAEIDSLPDPQKEYGSSLRERGKVSFQGLKKIIAAYKTVFRKKAETIFDQNKAVLALAAVRHVIAHKAGVADRKYLNAAKDFPELLQFTKVKLKQPIPLDGEMVRELRNAAINLGIELLLHVDGVIASREEKHASA